jgi:negative regulator of genetic competence, sporulation and motility
MLDSKVSPRPQNSKVTVTPIKITTAGSNSNVNSDSNSDSKPSSKAAVPTRAVLAAAKVEKEAEREIEKQKVKAAALLEKEAKAAKVESKPIVIESEVSRGSLSPILVPPSVPTLPYKGDI